MRVMHYNYTKHRLSEKKFTKHQRMLLRGSIVFGFFALLLLLILPIAHIGILLLLLALNVGMGWMRRKIRFSSIGVEFILITTVFSGAAFGWFAGAVMGLFCILINYAVARKKKKYFVMTVPLYTAIGIIAAFIPLTSLVTAGIVFAIGYNIISFTGASVMGAKKWGVFIFSVTNILFNVMLFTKVGPLLVHSLGGV